MKQTQQKNKTKRVNSFLKVKKLGKSKPRRNTRNKRKTNRTKRFSKTRTISSFRRRKNTRNTQKKKGKVLMKGGGIPFSEVSTLWDKTMFQFKEFSSPFFDKNMSVAGNVASNNPTVTHQFDRVNTPSGSTMVNTPDIGSITKQAFN